MTEKRVLSSKGQVVVPKAVREYLKIKEGDTLEFCIKETTGEVYLKPIRMEHPDQLYGLLPPKIKPIHDIDQVVQDSRAERNRVHRDKGTT